MKKIVIVLIACFVFLVIGCSQITSTTLQTSTTSFSTTATSTTQSLSPTDGALILNNHSVQKNIFKVDGFSRITADFSDYDYLMQAVRLDEIVFSFASNPNALQPAYINSNPNSWNPIGFWIDQARLPADYNPLVNGYLERTFGVPTYLGDNRVLSSGSEPITTISMVLGSSYANIDKSNQTYGDTLYDFVEMALSGYDTGSKLVHNIGAQGQSFWYDIVPQIMFSRLYDLYPNTPYMREMVLNGADEWLEALPYFETDGSPDYEFVGFNVVLESPTVTGGHIEPPNGGLAFLFYGAYQMTGEEKYLDGAKTVLDYFQTYTKNPNYEAMTDYAPYVAAILNTRYGTNYDIGKFLDFLFEEDSAFRPGWSVMTGSFGDHLVDGLVGQSGDYAFSMNTFHLASVLAPMVKYDTRYADSIGKYLLNVYNNAKVFFPQENTLAEQSMSSFLSYDRYGSICYEGFRNQSGGMAIGDATTTFSQPSDLSLYSSAFIGAFAGMISQTNQFGILQYNLNNTDSFGFNDYPQFLVYNPYDETKTIRFTGSVDSYDLFDTVSNSLVAKNVTGEINVELAAQSSVVLVVLPPNSQYYVDGDSIYANSDLISKYRASVNIMNLVSRQELTESSEIEITYFVPLGDEVENMKIYFGDILAYDGLPNSVFSYDKSILPNTDYEMKIMITTENGLQDYVTKRVICR